MCKSFLRKGLDGINHDKYLEELINQYGKLIFSICYKLTNSYFDAEDLAQDTFISAYKKLSSFDGQHEKAWICRIATNKCLDFLKGAERRSLPTEDEFFISVKNSSPTPEESILDNEVKQKLYFICSNLKPPYDELAVDYFCNEMDTKEIAEKTGKNIKTLQTQIYRAKEMIKAHWRKEQLVE